MNILISNDDGIGAIGIKILSQELAQKHNVYRVAPDREKSAKSQALTIHSPLRVKEITDNDFGAKKVWTVSGTPVDCVKIGISTILSEDEKPDVVISGINHGPNLGHDVRYSGTVGAALEGSMLGYPSIAVSLAAIKSEPKNFIYPAKFMLKFLDEYTPINPKTTLNINFPKVEENEIRGVLITQLAERIFTSQYEKHTDPQGKEYYWLAGKVANDEQYRQTDFYAIKNNHISITPLNYNMTDFNSMQPLSKIFDKQTVSP